MTEAEINAAFGGTSETSPIWLAVTEMLQRDVDDWVELVAAPEKTDSERQYYSGALQQSLMARHRFLDRMRMVKNA